LQTREEEKRGNGELRERQQRDLPPIGSLGSRAEWFIESLQFCALESQKIFGHHLISIYTDRFFYATLRAFFESKSSKRFTPSSSVLHFRAFLKKQSSVVAQKPHEK
jgi:hypothetical protein